LEEFLDLYHLRNDLLLIEEPEWTDDQLEEFCILRNAIRLLTHLYIGWPEWANQIHLHCVQCGAHDWKGVEFIDEHGHHIHHYVADHDHVEL
jgi:hypothetical protein